MIDSRMPHMDSALGLIQGSLVVLLYSKFCKVKTVTDKVVNHKLLQECFGDLEISVLHVYPPGSHRANFTSKYARSKMHLCGFSCVALARPCTVSAASSASANEFIAILPKAPHQPSCNPVVTSQVVINQARIPCRMRQHTINGFVFLGCRD